ncbi:MAG: DUF362 domain-containing protein [Fibrobacter sp.]|jgi:uncharacterized protein (DUF362 family)/Pyruvate/2-oxoacid:ferredoxin oxidoreductase delta subunit|nr:DUF362 domain-containing protein [Fibrobacter sp.]
MCKSSVAIVACGSYNQDEVNDAVKKGISLLGGIEQFCRSGEKILLKPNVLWGTDPERCVVTHPSVFKAVALLLQDHGVKLQYGDSPAGLQTSAQAMQKPGFNRIAAELNMEHGDFDHGRNVTFPEGIFCKQLFLVNAVFNSDGLVSLPKLKTHGLTRMTGAVKNQYGCIPGLVKGEYHARLTDVYDFSKLLVDINRFIKPRLYVMDAVYAMEGNGPQSGEPKKVGALLFSDDPVALDSTACRLIDLNPDFVPTIVEGVKGGLGVSSADAIHLIGEPIDNLISADFKVVKAAPVVLPQNGILRQIRSSFTPRPVINKEKCIQCLRCLKSCPVDPKALSCKDNQKIPRFDYKNCIRCFCCQEVCPEKAISIREPLLKKLFPVVSYISLFMANRYSKKQKENR